MIKHNLAPGSRVTLINQLQITRGSGVRHVCEGAINLGDKLLVSYRQATSPAFFITGATGTKKLLESTPCDFLEGSYVIKIDQSDRVASNKQRLLTIEDDRNVLIHLLF